MYSKRDHKQIMLVLPRNKRIVHDSKGKRSERI